MKRAVVRTLAQSWQSQKTILRICVLIGLLLLIGLVWGGDNEQTVHAAQPQQADAPDILLPLIAASSQAAGPQPSTPTSATTSAPTSTQTLTPVATSTPTPTPTPTATPEPTATFAATVTPIPSGQSNPILFVSQIPIRADFTTIGATFGNHRATMQSVGRGGDLWIRYPNGTRKNLTKAAGFGSTNLDGFQGADAIAVRDPDVHWSGAKALFSMVIGAPTEQYEHKDYYWQLYEIRGLRPDDTPVITKVPNQPADFNNVSPIYGTDDRIIFTSDRPRNGARHLYPQLDEYELAPTNTGLWSLAPTTGDLRLLNHAPSGNFTPLVDSFGRVLFTQWDHLQRDQQADADNAVEPGGVLPYGTFNYAGESADAAIVDSRAEIFPEPRRNSPDLTAGVVGLRFNHFFPWEINEDGTESEILNHLGRHELHDYFANNISMDENVVVFDPGNRANQQSIENFFHITEDPLRPGTYYGVDAPEFETHSSGMIVRLSAPLLQNPNTITVTHVTHPDTRGNRATPNHSGHYREPLPLADGTLVAIHTGPNGR